MASRRNFLAEIGAVSTIVVAGCADSSDGGDTSSSDGGDTSSSDGEDTSSSDGEDTSSSDGGDTGSSDGGDTGSSDGSPEEIFEQYITALQNGDTEGANTVLHPESPMYPHEDLTAAEEEISLNEVNGVSVREVVEKKYGTNLNETEVQEEVDKSEQTMEAIVSETGAEDFAIVLVSWNQEGESRKQEYILLQDDGSWYVYTA